MKQKLLLILLLFAIGTGGALAQSRKITGMVTSADDDQSLPGVSVKVRGTSVGTQTDAKGSYSLSVPQNATTLEFSYIGYTTQVVTINERSTINVALSAGSKALGE